MKRIALVLILFVVAGGFAGCLGVTQTLTPPTAAPTSPPAPTNVPTALPTATTPAHPTPPPSPVRANTPTPGGEIVITDPTLIKLVEDAKTDLTTRANVPLTGIMVKSTEAVEWRDSSLGCPIEGQMYTQVITPGYLIVLEAAGQEWNYHASSNHVMYCKN